MNSILQKALIVGLTAGLLGGACVSQPTRYENTTKAVKVSQAPAGFKKIKIALIRFKDATGKGQLVEPATAQLTSLMLQSGYFEIIEISLVENLIGKQSAISTEKLQELQRKFGARYFLTGTLTNFEVRQKRSGFCLFFGLLGSYEKKEYIVEAGIDYRMVSVPDGRIVQGGSVESQRTDTSKAAGAVFSYGGTNTRILQTNSGKLLRYALRDMIEQLIVKIKK